MCIERNDLEKDFKKIREEGERQGAIESRTREFLRLEGLHSELPGFELLVTAIAIDLILKYEFEEDIYQMVERLKVVPTIYPVIRDINPVEQHIKEVLRASGHDEVVIDFIKTTSEEISKHI